MNSGKFIASFITEVLQTNLTAVILVDDLRQSETFTVLDTFTDQLFLSMTVQISTDIKISILVT